MTQTNSIDLAMLLGDPYAYATVGYYLNLTHDQEELADYAASHSWLSTVEKPGEIGVEEWILQSPERYRALELYEMLQEGCISPARYRELLPLVEPHAVDGTRPG